MSKHTPRPWIANGKAGTHDGGSTKQHPCFLGTITAANGQNIVATFSSLGVQGETPAEAEANAMLFAAAPELLDAAKAIVKEDGFQESGLMRKRIDALRAAIAKADR